jgi:hypothetical protein
MRLKKPKRIKDVVRSTPKSTHTKSVSGVAKSLPKTTHPGKNLGKYLHKSKLPTGTKIGVTVKKPRKSNQPKASY